MGSQDYVPTLLIPLPSNRAQAPSLASEATRMGSVLPTPESCPSWLRKATKTRHIHHGTAFINNRRSKVNFNKGDMRVVLDGQESTCMRPEGTERGKPTGADGKEPCC